MAKTFFKKIVVAVNGTQSSLNAAMYAIMMAKTYKLSVCFVYVIDTATIKYLSMNKFLIADERMNLEEHLLADGEKILSHIAGLAASKGLKIDRQIRSGGIFTEILRVAEEYEADLIILGGKKSGKNAVSKRSGISSVENDVLSHSKIPVLVFQKDKIEDEFKIF